MTAAWVAGSTRARLLVGRRLGVDNARALAESGSLSNAAAALAGTRFARAAGAVSNLEEAQRAVADCLLLELRLLTGWLPVGAGELVRSLAAWFELVNIEDRLTYLLGGELRTPSTLGALGSAWPRVAVAETPAELREALRASAWGDTRGERADMIHFALRLAWARRVYASAPEARAWVAGAVAILLARELFVSGRPIEPGRSPLLRDLGPSWSKKRTLAEFTQALPPRAAWSLAGLTEPQELWRAETGWWRRVAGDAEFLVRGSREGQAVVVGCVALLALDAMQVSAALALAARPTAPGREAFGALL